MKIAFSKESRINIVVQVDTEEASRVFSGGGSLLQLGHKLADSYADDAATRAQEAADLAATLATAATAAAARADASADLAEIAAEEAEGSAAVAEENAAPTWPPPSCPKCGSVLHGGAVTCQRALCPFAEEADCPACNCPACRKLILDARGTRGEG